MKKFVCKSISLMMAFAAFNLIVLLVIPKDQNNYLCEYNHKIHLLETTPQPRMIFIGGSNIAFGMDSKIVGDSLNYHIVNFGLHGGIGIRYPVEDALQYIKKGDVVVLQFEYGNFISGGNGEPETLPKQMISTNWRNAGKLNVSQWKNIISGFPNTSFGAMIRLAKYPIRGTFNTPAEGPKFEYAASGFNEYGDEISHFNYPNIKYVPSSDGETKKVDPEFINWLSHAIEQYEQAGAIVVMLPPVCISSHFRLLYNEQIGEALSAIHHPYIVSPSSMVLDDSCIFNTGYHVNREGCIQNTQNIIRALLFLKKYDKLH